MAAVRTQPARARARAAIVALLCVVGQVWLGIDGVAHRHARCAEHGELVHAEHGGAEPGGDERGGDERDLAAGPGGGDAAAWRDRGGDDHGDHAHCSAIFCGRELPAVPALARRPAPPSTVAEQHHGHRAGLAGFHLYRLAPKTSPPRPT